MIEEHQGSKHDEIDWDKEARLLTNPQEDQARYIRGLEEKAQSDSLTGLMNRAAFDREASKLLGQRRGDAECVSVLLIDIDHFKSVNDTYGHPEGDAVLRKLAEVLKAHVRREDDLVGRYGGEEFVIALKNPKGFAQQMAETLRKDIEVSVRTKDNKAVTVSIGIAETTANRKLQSLYASADKALYHAKEAGRNQVVVAGLLSEAA